jgi:ribosomal protein L37AE/L43A
MGGYGSGQYHRCYVRKSRVDDYTLLDINSFKKRGRWRFYSGTVTWKQGKAITAHVCYDVFPHSIHLGWCNSDGEITRQVISLTTVQQRIGTRYYFKCPQCGKRVVDLYAGSLFRCRHCYNLTYESCQDSRVKFFDGLLTGKTISKLLESCSVRERVE